MNETLDQWRIKDLQNIIEEQSLKVKELNVIIEQQKEIIKLKDTITNLLEHQIRMLRNKDS